MKIIIFLTLILFFSVFGNEVKAETIHIIPPNASDVEYILEKNDNGLWNKKMFFPINNLKTQENYIYNLEKSIWEKHITNKDITINPIFRVNQDGTKDISYDLGHQWYKVTDRDDLMSDNIIAYFNQNEETIAYQVSNMDLHDIIEISLFDLNGKELYKTDEIQPYGSLSVANISNNIIFICFKLNNTNITKKVIIF